MKNTVAVFVSWMLILTLAGCAGAQVAPSAGVSEGQSSNVPTTEATAATLQDTSVAVEATAALTPASSVPEVLAQKSEAHDDADDYVWESSAEIPIVLNGDSITAEGAGVTVNGSKVTISSAGIYRLSGTLSDGQIIVNTEDQAAVRLILNGVDIRNTTSAPIYVMNADEAIIVLADNTENYISDGASYVFEAADQDEPNAAIFSASDLTIFGNGSLTVVGNYNDAITSEDGLVMTSGTIAVRSVDDGIRGKDYLVVKDGNITVDAQGDGLKSDNAEDASMGYITIEGGVIHVTSAGDAMQAETDVMITDGAITLASGGGSDNQVGADTSAKGIKAVARVNIDGGTFAIDSADDAINSNGSLTINGGTFVIASADDGIHADASVEVNASDIRITESYEGIESAVITINAGAIHVVSSDDGVNVAGGNDGSGMRPRGARGQGGGQDTFTYTGSNYLNINGGYLVVDAAGDGLDSNGAIKMTDGVVLVNGPTERMNGALDYDGGFNMTGGFFVAAGSAGMAQASDASSGQYAVLLNYSSTQPAGGLVHIEDSEGEVILTFAPSKEYQSIAFSSPELREGATYAIYTGGSASGTVSDGLYQDGTYSPGAQYTSFTVSDVVTMIGNRSR